MPINPYFNFTDFASEQNLVEDLIIEAIQIYGHEAWYIPREDVDLDTILGEDELSKYEHAFPVEIYMESFDSFSGQSEFISKFGLHIEDQAKFLVAARRFNEATENTLVRPRENDIIYIQFTPDNRYMFEIRFVENKEKIFQLGKLYTYELRCEMMNFSHERVQTDIPDINARTGEQAYTIAISLAGGTGDYLNEEVVYQGASFVDAVATGTVFSSNSSVLRVQNITGTFNGNTAITGVTSGASYTPSAEPSEFPTAHDPIADNQELETEKPDIIVSRGTNPITGR
jgi:Virus neck protein